MFGNDTYGWDKVFGLEETTKKKYQFLMAEIHSN